MTEHVEVFPTPTKAGHIRGMLVDMGDDYIICPACQDSPGIPPPDTSD